MLRQATVLAVLAGIAAFLFSKLAAEEDGRFLFRPIPGRNNTVLFITDEHPGFCNVHLATVYSLLENHPQLEIHYLSYPKNAERLEKISSLAAKGLSSGKKVQFHLLEGSSYTKALEKAAGNQTAMVHEPGLAAAEHLSKDMDSYIAPWSAEEYWNIYQSISQVIDEVDPAVIIIDTFFSPGIDATRDKRRLHALVTPNILSDLTPAAQPPWTLFWKYPALGSGIPFPVPWKLIPANIYINIRIIRGMLYLPRLRAKREFLEKMGVKNPINFMGVYRPDVPWLTQTLPGVHIPLVSIPQNVTLTGPINLAGVEVKTATAQELLDWIEKPTVLISLGSGFKYTEQLAKTMLGGIVSVLKETDVQVLWKMEKLEQFDGEFLEAAARQWSGRLRIEKWLDVAPPTLVQNGRIVVFVHHGGAGCFHDAIGGGVPQVILPQWADLYDIAQLAESLDIGVWACRETSPSWTPECIGKAITDVINDTPASTSMAKKAASIGERARKAVGRDVAAQEIASLAASGHA